MNHNQIIHKLPPRFQTNNMAQRMFGCGFGSGWWGSKQVDELAHPVFSEADNENRMTKSAWGAVSLFTKQSFCFRVSGHVWFGSLEKKHAMHEPHLNITYRHRHGQIHTYKCVILASVSSNPFTNSWAHFHFTPPLSIFQRRCYLHIFSHTYKYLVVKLVKLGIFIAVDRPSHYKLVSRAGPHLMLHPSCLCCFLPGVLV